MPKVTQLDQGFEPSTSPFLHCFHISLLCHHASRTRMPSVGTKEAVRVKCWHTVISQRMLAASAIVIIMTMTNILAHLPPVLVGELSEDRHQVSFIY